ncbi:MAG: AAA family ATPase [Planctomycetota bacterium]
MRSVPEDRAQAWLREIFLAPGLTPPATHALLRRVGATAALTTNFDTLLEQSLLSPNDRVYTPEDAESLLEALTQREFFVAKLYGQLGVSSSLLLAPSEYEDRIVGNRRFAEFMELLFASRTVFFVGCSLDGIASYLEGLRFRSSDARHFALVAVSGSAWEVKAEQLRGRYGIEVLPYVAEEGHAEVTSFLDELVARVDAGKADRGTAGQSGERGGIRSISLRNVGPFRGPEPVELSFDRGWNVLLGDNGVGKSTVLKAIAVAFAGRSAEPYAERLISHDAEEARVVVRTARETYTTVIARTSDGCEVTSLPSRPLEAEGLLILAFPALRSVSWRRAKASATDFSSRKPDPEDVLPLLTGDPDPRLDELKDWLYSIESWSRMQRDVDHARVRRELFRVLREVASGVEIDYLGADDRGGLEVSLFGEPAPLEVVSQGTASLFGWLGVLVRRLYRVSRDSSHALGSPAVVLLDEIDAHMHPGWQQELVPRLSAAFPNVQFIVTTHSALVLGNLESGRVYSFERSGDFPSPIKANAHVIEPGLGVSGLLTSSRFGLATELDQDTQGLLDEKVNYVIKDSLSDEDRARLEEVDRLLDNRGLLTRYKDPLYTRFLRAAARESNASAQELRTEYTDVDRERDRRMIDELRAELAEENEGADS